MKTANKIVSLFLIGILLSSTIGLFVNEHYCAENDITTSVGTTVPVACACEIPMQEECCTDTSTFYALTSLFNLARATLSSQPAFKVIEPIKFNRVAIANQPLHINVVKDFSYPLAESNLFLKVQSLLL